MNDRERPDCDGDHAPENRVHSKERWTSAPRARKGVTTALAEAGPPRLYIATLMIMVRLFRLCGGDHRSEMHPAKAVSHWHGMIDVIVPNLKWRYSGVTSANRNVTPLVARELNVRWFGSYRPDGVSALSLPQLLRLRFHRPGIVWHARRNIEMVVGLLLKRLGWPFVLIFTSAGQRNHQRFTKYLISRMDHIIATSALSAAFVKRPSHIIHHGVDTKRYAPEPDRATAFSQAGLPGRYAIGCFGRVRHQKGTDLFVEAVCRLFPKYPDVSAVIVGQITSDQQDFARQLTARIDAAGLTGRVKILGELPIDDVVAWFRRISIYAFTSRVEGFGLTILEAMSSGNAIVATRAGAAEIVIRDGVDGLLVKPDNLDDLLRAIETFLKSPETIEQYGTAARNRVVESFDLDNEAAQTAGFYRAALAGTARDDHRS